MEETEATTAATATPPYCSSLRIAAAARGRRGDTDRCMGGRKEATAAAAAAASEGLEHVLFGDGGKKPAR